MPRRSTKSTATTWCPFRMETFMRFVNDCTRTTSCQCICYTGNATPHKYRCCALKSYQTPPSRWNILAPLYSLWICPANSSRIAWPGRCNKFCENLKYAKPWNVPKPTYSEMQEQLMYMNPENIQYYCAEYHTMCNIMDSYQRERTHRIVRNPIMKLGIDLNTTCPHGARTCCNSAYKKHNIQILVVAFHTDQIQSIPWPKPYFQESNVEL